MSAETYEGVASGQFQSRTLMSRIIERIVSLIAPPGWHLQVFLPPAELVDVAPALRRLPVDVVIDHLGLCDPRLGFDNPVFATLLGLLEGGNTWIKLTAYRVSARSAPFEDVGPLVRKLARVRSDRLVWGNNWPHPIQYGPMPDDGDLLDALAEWIGDDDVLKQVLVDNPSQLYGFGH